MFNFIISYPAFGQINIISFLFIEDPVVKNPMFSIFSCFCSVTKTLLWFQLHCIYCVCFSTFLLLLVVVLCFSCIFLFWFGLYLVFLTENKKFHFFSFVKKNSQKQLRSKRADHVNNVDSPCFLIFIFINVIALLWFGLYFVLYLHNSINSLPFKQTSQLSTVSAFPNHGNKENCKLLYKHHLRWRWHQRL